LPHQEHKNTANKGQHQYSDTTKGDHGNRPVLFGKPNEPVYEPVVLNGSFFRLNAKSLSHHIEYIAGNLGGQYSKIV